MVTVLGIFMVLTSVVLFNYNKFRSETILTNMAYEVALSVREAQIYGVSVRNPNGSMETASFSVPYGIHFMAPSSGDGTASYFLFADQNQNGLYQDTSCLSGMDECVTPYTLQRGMVIDSIATKTGTGFCDYPTEASVVFKRPNPEPIIDNDYDVSFVEVRLKATDGAVRYVVIRNNGQIYVDNTTACGT